MNSDEAMTNAYAKQAKMFREAYNSLTEEHELLKKEHAMTRKEHALTKKELALHKKSKPKAGEKSARSKRS